MAGKIARWVRAGLAALAAAALLAGCGAGAGDDAEVTTRAMADLPEGAASASLAAAPGPDTPAADTGPSGPGFLRALLGGGSAAQAAPGADAPASDALEAAPSGAEAQADESGAPASSRGGGFLAGLFGGGGGGFAETERAVGGPGPEATPARVSGSEPDVTPGAPLDFGAVGRVCDLLRGDRGDRVARFPENRLRGGYALYDSAPGSSTARAFYITGFSDGCARVVTAANVVFGAPSMHERLRYGLPAGTLPVSRTDEAYKTLKARICRVPRSAPCGDRIDRLERNTVFVTMYESFTGNRNWSNLLLHDGAVLAADRKSTAG
jgi:hypothetical protein